MSVKSNATVEYWKSVPYFINFMDGYQLADRVRESLKTAAGRAQLEPLLRRTQRLDRGALEGFGPIDLGNGRLRALAAETVDQGMVAAALGTAIHALSRRLPGPTPIPLRRA